MIPNIESKISFDWDLLLWNSSVIISKVHPVFSSGKKSLFIDNLKVGNLCWNLPTTNFKFPSTFKIEIFPVESSY